MVTVRLVDETVAFLPAGALEAFRRDLGLGYAEAGVVLAAAAPGAMVGTLASIAADHVSRRAIAAGGTAAYAACLAAFGLGGSFPVLVAASFVAGAASTAMVDAAEVALVDLAGGDLRRWLTRSNLLAAIGDLAGPALLAGVALVGLSWRAAFLVGAALLAGYAVIFTVTPLPPPGPTSDAGDGTGQHGDEVRSPRRVLALVLQDRRVWLVGVMSLLLGPFDEPFVGFTIALVDQTRGLDPATSNLVGLVSVSGGLVAFTVLAARLRAADDDRLLIGAATLMTGGALAVAFVPTLPLLAAGGFAVSLGLNAAWLALQHRTLTLRPGQAGTTKAVVSTIEFAGFGLPIAIGALADRTTLPLGVAGYGLLGAAFTALALLSARRRPHWRR